LQFRPKKQKAKGSIFDSIFGCCTTKDKSGGIEKKQLPAKRPIHIEEESVEELI
jgi:hypothetical protein